MQAVTSRKPGPDCGREVWDVESLDGKAKAAAYADCHGVESENGRRDCEHGAVVADEVAKICHVNPFRKSTLHGVPRETGRRPMASLPANLPRDDLYIGEVSGNMSQDRKII